ncbi:MAG: PP2C family protein-serine/threonine phosphatase [Pseudomonadota bacterium]|nr:PP2C family protein-serine/threonine phosphatase [Pseudomonadota bacterium]
MTHAPTLPFSVGAAATRTGANHAENEDRHRVLDASHLGVAALRRGSLYAVCDGVSTVPRGRYAAELTCARIDGFFDRFQAPRVESLVQLVSETDWELRAHGRGQAACTLSMLWLAYGTATVLHVGDSQVYRVRNDTVERITKTHRGGRALGAYVGMGPNVADVMQVWQEPLFVGDLFLLVTDGVTEVVAVDDLLDTWWAFGGSPQRAAAAIIREVDQRGGRDDATALVVDVLALETDPDGESTFSGRTEFRRARGD